MRINGKTLHGTDCRKALIESLGATPSTALANREARVSQLAGLYAAANSQCGEGSHNWEVSPTIDDEPLELLQDCKVEKFNDDTVLESLSLSDLLAYGQYAMQRALFRKGRLSFDCQTSVVQFERVLRRYFAKFNRIMNKKEQKRLAICFSVC